MKYMKLGTKPDTFYTEEATRTVLSDVPTDLNIQINNTKYLLHKFPLLLKCGLLQRLCSDSSTSSPPSSGAPASSSSSSSPSPIVLTDFPGGEAAFELCAKFCYSISITLSAHNFIPAFSAATLLLMTDSVSPPNFLSKLHTFFASFILPNWKDSVVTLASASPPFSEPAIVRPLTDSIVNKILTPTSQVTWSFTYSRELAQPSVPKDWWTEDIADLDLNHFRSIISAVKSSKLLHPALIGEALHVYTVKNLPNPNVAGELRREDRRVLEAIVSMVPAEHGAVSGGFLMRLLKIAILVGASASVKAELVMRAGRQLDEVSVRDLVLYRWDEKGGAVDLGMAEAVVESFLEGFRTRRTVEKEERGRMRRVARLFDDYLGAVAGDGELSVDKFIELAELVPEVAREEHDELYRAIDAFLEEHPGLSKPERKRLCQLIDCRKLSPEVRSEAIANERLPLRTLVQLLFIEHERVGGTGGNRGTAVTLHSNARESHDQPRRYSNGRESHEQPRRSRQEQEDHKHQRQAEELAEGVRSRLAGDVAAATAARKKGEGSGSRAQANKGRADQADAEKKKKKMDKGVPG